VINAGLKIKLVDVDINGLMNLEELEKKISKKTKAVIPVHLYGQPLNMKKLTQIKKKYNFYIIEDCAQAHGAFDYSTNQKIGCIGDIACYSFYPGKNLGAFGDAGAIVTNNKNLYKKL
jgi:dTDP-4-amino-4,6-dideoxygalactose transaminase